MGPQKDPAARDAKNQTAILRAEADELRTLPVSDAAQMTKVKRAEQEHRRQQVAERQR